MSKAIPPEVVSLESPWSCQPGIVRVLRRHDEPAAAALVVRSDCEGMTRPYIFETGAVRSLRFTQDATQSAMSLLEPDSLVAPYTRKMMAFLLMNPDPRHIVMLGLGGGSLAKFCYRYLPTTRITVVEIDADVIAMRDEFKIPRDDGRFRVVHDDGVRYLARLRNRIDVLLVDAFDADGVAISLSKPHFCRIVARRLSQHGVAVMNFWGRADRYSRILGHAAAVFGKHALLVSVADEPNVLLFASRHPPPAAIDDHLESMAGRLQRVLKLDFPRFLRRICQGRTLLAPGSPGPAGPTFNRPR